MPRLAPALLSMPAMLVLLAGCTPSAPQPAGVANVPPPPTSRFDGSYRGIATRSFGTETNCGRPSAPLTMVVAQGRATGTLPSQGEARGNVAGDGSLTLRANLDAAQRASGRISDSGEFTGRFQTNRCAWDIRLNRNA